MRVAVFAPEGYFKNYQTMLAQCAMDAFAVEKLEDPLAWDGLIFSGIKAKMMKTPVMTDFLQMMDQNTLQKRAILAVGAGLTSISRSMEKEANPDSALLDVWVEEKGFGENHFIVPLTIMALGKAPFPGVFQEAPAVTEVRPNVGILATHEEKIVMVRQGNILAAAFHPELSNDLRVFLYFKKMMEDAGG